MQNMSLISSVQDKKENMTLSEKEILQLAEHVTKLLYTEPGADAEPNLEEALHDLNIIIENSNPNAFFYSERAKVHSRLHRLSFAINDISKAIELEPGRVAHYLYRALFSGMEVWNFSKDLNGTVISPPKETVNNQIIDFQSVLQKDPTLSEGWIGLMACNILQNQWDNTISLAGESNQFVTEPVDKAARTWLLYLAALFIGDEITADDLKQIFDVDYIDGYFIERIMLHVVTLCCDLKIPTTYVEHITAVNYLVLDRMSDRKRAIRLCRTCGYLEKEMELLDQYLNQNPEDCDSWFDKEKALAEIIGRDAVIKIWGMNDSRVMGCRINWQMMNEKEKYSKFRDLCLHDYRNEERLRLLSKVIELNPEYNIAKTKMADLLFDYGRYEQAWAVADSMEVFEWIKASEGPRDLALFIRERILEALCNMYIKEGQLNNALKILNKEITDKTPQEAHMLAGTWFQKARVCSAMEDRSNALLCLQKVFTLEPERRKWVIVTEDELLHDLLLDKALQTRRFQNVSPFKKIRNLFSSRGK